MSWVERGSSSAGLTGPALLLQRGAHSLSKLAAVLAALLIVAMALHILLEIVLRIFDRSTFVLDEMVGYAIAAATFLSLGYAFEHGALVRVGLLVERLAGPSRRILEAACAVATLVVMSQIALTLTTTTIRSFERGRTSSSIAEVPLWIPEAVCAAGLLIFCLQVFVWFLRQVLDLPSLVGDSAADDPPQGDL